MPLQGWRIGSRLSRWCTPYPATGRLSSDPSCGGKMIDTVKSLRKCLRRHFQWEVNGHKDGIFVVIVSVPGRLVSIGIKPSTDFDQPRRKFTRAYPDCDAAHRPLNCVPEGSQSCEHTLGKWSKARRQCCRRQGERCTRLSQRRRKQ